MESTELGIWKQSIDTFKSESLNPRNVPMSVSDHTCTSFLISDSILEQGTGANMLRNYFLFCFPVLP